MPELDVDAASFILNEKAFPYGLEEGDKSGEINGQTKRGSFGPHTLNAGNCADYARREVTPIE